MLEKYYPYYIGEQEPANYQCLSAAPLWVCQSHEFGRKLGRALKELHELSNNSKIYKRDFLVKQPSSNVAFSQKYKQCKKLLKSHQATFESCGFPISIIEEVFFSFEGMEISGEPVLIHGHLSCENIILTENLEFSGIKNWQASHLGNRGTDLAIAWLIFEEPVAKSFFQAYGQVEESQFELSLFQSLYSSLSGLVTAVESKNEHLRQWMEFALRKAIGL